MSEITAGCLQFRVEPGEIDRNVAFVEKTIAESANEGCQLLVLPEMWSCSFVYSALRDMAKRTTGILDLMREWGRRYGMVLTGSLPEEDEGSIYNTSYVIDADGRIAGKYRKIHLFSLHGEDRHFGRGLKTLVCSTKIGQVGVMICYDLRFPELARKLALDGAQFLCISAMWPVTRIDHWSLLLRSRAVENQLFVIGCNGTGTEGKLQYGGASAIISPTGNVLAQAGSGQERILARVATDEIAAFRKLIPCLSDRFPDAYSSSCGTIEDK
jgi:omega-amidase